ncbi:MAG TPA: hypothetical protein VMP03_12445, partial [Methylomirabilota bacterium]|nr:hypothetical protein [Methylomirabilota bacterium]
MTTIENRPTTGDGGPDPVFPRRRRRWPRAVAIVLVLLAVGASALTWRLLDRPIWTDLLAGTVAARVAAELGPDAKVDVGVVGLSLDQGYRPEFHLRDIVISQPGKGSVSIDSLSVSRAWSGSARRAERVVADHVLIDIIGGIRPLPAAAEVLAALDAALARPPVGFVEIGSLTIGRRVGTSQRAIAVERAAVTMEVADDGGIRMSLAGAGAEGPWSIRALGSAADAVGARTVDVRGTGLDVADLVAMAVEGPPLASGPIGFEGTITLTDGAVTDGRGQLTVGPLRAPDDTALPLVGGRSRLEVAMRAGGRTVVVLPSPIVLPGGQAILSGEIDVPQDGETAWPFDLKISLRGTAAADERRGAGEISGRYDPAEGLFVVDRFQASGEGTTFTSAMRVTHSEGRVAGALSGVFSSMSVDALKAIWPSFVVADGRRWVMGHVESGMIRDATVDLTFSDQSIDDAAAAATATVNFRVEDLAFKVLDDGPMIRGATGSGRLQDGRFEVTLDGGDVDLGADGTLAIPSGRFVIPEISVRPPRGEVAISLSGDARASLAMWARLPISRAAPLPVAPADASGSMAANIALSLPLVRGVKAAEVSYEAQLRLAELAFATPVEGRRLSDGSLQITVADGVAKVAGDALLDGVRAEIDLSESLTGDGRSASAVRLRLSGKDRERLGIGLKDVLIGPVGVSIGTVEAADGEEVQTVEVDLAETRLRIRPLGIDKKKGVPGTARFTMKKTGSQIIVDDLRLEADGAVIVGDLRLDADGRLLSATLPRIAARAGDRLSLTATRAGDGVLDVEVRGDRFDARRLVRSQLRGAGPTEAGDALRVDVTIGVVTGFGDEALTGFNLAAALSG